MKKIILLLILASAGKFSFSQNVHPATWTYSIEQGKDGNTTLIFKVKLDKDWHIYSQFTPDGGPLPMVYKFEPSNGYDLIGKCEEPKPHEEFDSTFGVKVFIFDGEVTFRQHVKVKTAGCKIKGTIEYQVCKEACIFQETAFVFDIEKLNSR